MRPFTALRPFSLSILFAAILAVPGRAQKIEAEAWSSMAGLQTEATADAGGGLNVGWIDPGDWAEYLNKPLAAGDWKVDARVATMAVNRQIQVYVDDVLKTTITYAGNTNGWQNWVTVTSAAFNVPAGGNHKIKLAFPGNNLNVNWINFIAQTADNVPPTAPTGLNAPLKTNTSVSLSWTASADAGTGVASYDVYDGAALIGNSGTATTFLAYGLAANSTHTFTVKAKDGAGNVSAASNAATATTTNAANLLVNGDFAAGLANWTAYQGTSLNVAGEYAMAVPATANVYDVNAWQKVAMTQGVSYTLTFRARSNINRTLVGGWGFAHDPWTNQSQTFNLTAAWQSYSMTAVSTVPGDANSRAFFDVAGPAGGEIHFDDVVLSQAATADVQAPTAPRNLASPAQTANSINLAWTASTDNVAVTAYDVLQGTTVIGSTAGTVFQATGLAASTAYIFTVRARDAAGNVSAASAPLTVSTQVAVATNLLSNGDFSNGYADWTVYQGTNLGVAGEFAVAVPATPNVWDVNVWHGVAMTQGASYTLAFRARSDGNKSIVAGWGFAHDPWTNQNRTFNLTATWQDFVFTGVSTVPTDAVSRVFFDIGGAAGEVHIDNVVLTQGGFADTQAPAVPTGLALAGQAETTLNLTWNAATDNVGVTGYEIWINGTLNATVGNATAGTAANLAKGTAYSVQVRAFDAAGNRSALSTAITATTADGQTALKVEAEAWTRMNGLQTEATTDVGGGLNVGWIDPGDWAEYANQPLAAGDYRLEARMATQDANRSVQFWVDGALKTTATYAGNTAGWQNWVTVASPEFNVPNGGNHLLRIGFPVNNMNLNWFRVVPSAPDVIAPGVPAGLASTAQSGATITLGWTTPADNVGVTGYEIYVGNALKATVGAVNAATVSGLNPSTTYSIAIVAFDAAGNRSARSAAITASTTDGSTLGGIYVLRDRNSLKCVETMAAGVDNGIGVDQGVCDGSRAQKWELTLVSGNVYKLKNVNSGKLLDVRGGGSTNDVQQWEDVNGAAQQWRILAAGNGHYTLNAASDLTECLDVLGGSQASGAAMQTNPCAGSASQQFALVSTESVTSCVAGPGPAAPIAVQELWPGQGFVQPMEIVQEPPAAGDAFVVMDKTGMVRRVLADANDNVNRVFFNMEGRLTTTGESGLASLAFDPAYGQANRYVYVTYLSAAPQELRLSRFTANATGTSVDLATETVLFRFPQTSDIHHSGALVFGPGPVAGTQYLYFSVGDNGNNAAGDPTPVKVTRMNWPNGKILRLAPAEYRSAGALPWDFTDGATNPYIVATGFRNPWRMSFDGDDLWISNVGFDKYEEINKFNVKTELGKNFGWPWCEGNLCCSNGIDCTLPGLPPMPNDLVFPVHTYPRSDGTTGEGAVIGGFVYRGTTVPALTGKYVFADFVDQIVYALDPATKARTAILTGMGNIADIGQDRNGEILLTDYGRSNIYKIVPGAGGPVLAWPPANLADAGCFESLGNGNPVPKASVQPYDVAQKFWSDGADKSRLVSLPAGATLDVTDQDHWSLPLGGVAIKNFFWQGNIFETRLFVRHSDNVYAGYTYKWNSPISAVLVSSDGDTKDLGGGMIWKYPSRAQCMACHNDKVGGSIGFESRQMNVGNQIANLRQKGLLSAPIAAPLPPFPDPQDWSVPVGDRAVAYLHVNCATCHRGPGNSAAGQAKWDARYGTPLASKSACDEVPSPPVSGDLNERIIKPGNSALSTVWLRAHQRTNLYMPPLGSQVPDAAGVQVLADWINQLTGCK